MKIEIKNNKIYIKEQHTTVILDTWEQVEYYLRTKLYIREREREVFCKYISRTRY